MDRTRSGLKTIQPVPSVEAPPHNAGEVSSILSTTSKLRCVSRRRKFAHTPGSDGVKDHEQDIV
jgi:hypothetical protein